MIKNPESGETYCILTVCIIRSLQICFVFSILVAFFRLFFICFGDNFSKLILETRSSYLLYFAYLVLANIQFFITDLLFFMQIIEWSLIIFVIRSQRKLTDGEITHLHSRGGQNLKFRISLGLGKDNVDGSQTYKNNEQRIAFFFVASIVVISISWLFLFTTELVCTNLLEISWIYMYLPYIAEMTLVFTKLCVFFYMIHLMRCHAN